MKKVYCFNWLPLKYMIKTFQLVCMNIYQKQLPRGVSGNELKSENTETLYIL